MASGNVSVTDSPTTIVASEIVSFSAGNVTTTGSTAIVNFTDSMVPPVAESVAV